MIGSRIPDAKRLTNRTPPINPADMSEANANNYMFLFDNISTGEYIEDGAVKARHIDNLFVHEQAVPNLTLAVDAGSATFATTFVAFASGNTPTIAAPISNPRIDMVCLKSDGTITVTAGAENASPVAPVVPVNSIPLCLVYCVVGMTTIRDYDEQVAGQGYILTDLRPFIGIGGGVIKSVQTGQATADSTVAGLQTITTDVTISSVDLTKAIAVNCGYIVTAAGSNTLSAGGGGPQVEMYFTSATNLRIKSSFNNSDSGSHFTLQISWEVIEYL